MIDLSYSLVIEATEDPNFLTYFSPELEGFSGVGHSIEDCVYKARSGMAEHAELLGLAVVACAFAKSRSESDHSGRDVASGLAE